jgi:hypothetical protein
LDDNREDPVVKRALIAIAAAALLAVVMPAGPVGAQATTDVYVVHGLNLDGQSSPDEGGTAVTVCSGEAALIEDFQFGEVVGPVPLTSGEAVPVQVYVGEVVCATVDPTTALIDQSVTPSGAAVAVVATSNGEQLDPELLPIPLDVDCVDAGSGRAVAVHAANAPEVDVVNTDLGISVGTISYGEQISGQLPAGTYGIEVFVVGDPTDPVLEFDIEVAEGTVTAGIAVGGQPAEGEGTTPVLILPLVIPVDTCTTPTTAAPPTTATPTTAAAAAAAARPSFTG